MLPFVPSYLGWCLVNLTHAFFTFKVLHWNKGTPDVFDDGKFDRMTFWEQIDHGCQHTKTRKGFMLVPIIVLRDKLEKEIFTPKYMGLVFWISSEASCFYG